MEGGKIMRGETIMREEKKMVTEGGGRDNINRGEAVMITKMMMMMMGRKRERENEIREIMSKEHLTTTTIPPHTSPSSHSPFINTKTSRIEKKRKQKKTRKSGEGRKEGIKEREKERRPEMNFYRQPHKLD